MAYYKVNQNGNIVDAGITFLEWNEKYHQMFVTDMNKAQFVGGYDGNKFYRDEWMKPYPKEANGFEDAEVTIIEKPEYNDLLELLKEGEIIPEEEEMIEENPPVHDVEEPQDSSEERPLTLGEMRALILEQQRQIDALIRAQQN